MLTLHASARIALAVAAIAAIALTAQSAHASEGSIPAEVQEYANDPDGLIASLDDLIGVGSNGQGIAFDDTTKVGQLNRVFTWTDEFLSGTATEVVVERQNEWVAPVTIGDKYLGLATIWINPATVQPELADFVQGVSLAATIAEIPKDAYLVRDDEREAWFTLVGSTLSPLVAGQSGISGSTTIGVYQGLIVRRADNEAAAEPTPQTGIVTSVLIAGGALVGTALVLALFELRDRRRATPADADAPVKRKSRDLT